VHPELLDENLVQKHDLCSNKYGISTFNLQVLFYENLYLFVVAIF